MLFAAKYMVPGGRRDALLTMALPLYEEAAGAMRALRHVAMKREAEVLEPAATRATRAAETMHAALGDLARFKGRPFAEVIAEIVDADSGGSGGGGGSGGSGSGGAFALATVGGAAAAYSGGSVKQPFHS